MATNARSSIWQPPKRFWWLAGGMLAVAATVTTATVVGRGRAVREATIPAGTRIVGTLNRTVSTKNDPVGQTVQIRTTGPLRLSEEVILPAGLVVRGDVTHAKGGGRISGAPELTIRFNQIVSDNRVYPIAADPFRLRGKSDTKESIAEIAGGTVAGAIVGKVAGSTAKGAVIGAVIGTGVAVATKGNQIVLPAGQQIRVRLAEPVDVTYRPSPERS